MAYVAVRPDEQADSTVSFLEEAVAFFAEPRCPGRAGDDRQRLDLYALDAARRALADLGIRHLRTRPRRPQTNGKAERFIGTIQREWAYARLFRSNQERLATLPGWVDAYNRRRPHAGLDGQTPLSVLVNKVEENDN